MFKREWTVFGVLSACTVAVTFFSIFYTRSDGTKVAWLSNVAVVAIVATFAFLAVLLYLNAKHKFYRLLSNEHFVPQKQYTWDDQKLFIDFDSQRIANTYLSTKPFVAFDEVVSFRIERYHIGARAELPEDQCFVSLVIAVKKEGFESEYLYISAYEVQVESADIQEDLKEISAELVEKYPELQQLFELQSDVKSILEMNKANANRANVENS